MFAEVALTTSSTDPTSYLWDVRSGTVYFSFKQNLCPKAGLATAPVHAAPGNRVGVVIAAQADKPVVNIYTWQKVWMCLRFCGVQWSVSVCRRLAIDN